MRPSHSLSDRQPEQKPRHKANSSQQTATSSSPESHHTTTSHEPESPVRHNQSSQPNEFATGDENQQGTQEQDRNENGQSDSPKQQSGKDENDGGLENSDNDDQGGSPEQEAQAAPVQRVKRPRPKLTFEFFKPKPRDLDLANAENDSAEVMDATTEEEPKDLLWPLFLDVVAKFPPLESQPVVSSSSSSELTTQRRQEEMTRLDALLAAIRRWSQSNYHCGLSLLEFAQKVEKLTVKQDFYDYRQELLKRYITTDWKEEAKRNAEEQAATAQETFTSAASFGQSEPTSSFRRTTGGGLNNTVQRGVDLADDDWMNEWEGRRTTPDSAARTRFSVDGNKNQPDLSQQRGQAQQQTPVTDRVLSKEKLEEMKRRKAELLAKREADKKAKLAK